MSTTSSDFCKNCNTKNELPFRYCHNCGQKNTSGKITFSELWTEFQDAVFNIESRTWRTLKKLFIPGRLTLEYFSGKHRKYVHPLRLLIVTTLLLVVAMSYQDFQSATNHGYNIKERILKNYERQRIYGILKNITDSTTVIFPEQQAAVITDTILSAFKDSMRVLLFESSNPFANRYGDRYRDSINLNQYASFGDEGSEMVSKRDFLQMNEDELAAVYKKNAGSFEHLVFRQKVKMINDESQIFATLIGHVTWVVLLMMPCLALVLYFLNIRHGYYYIEHLIFTFHLHSFSFLLLAVLIGGLNIFPWWIFPVFTAIILIYVFVSMRKVYRQSIGKTLLKFILLGISYPGIFILFLFGNIFISFLLL